VCEINDPRHICDEYLVLSTTSGMTGTNPSGEQSPLARPQLIHGSPRSDHTTKVTHPIVRDRAKAEVRKGKGKEGSSS
jgi:hypothetical protein